MARIRVSTWDLSFEPGIWARRLEFGRQGWDLGLKAGIWALRVEFGLKARTWASSLGLGPWAGN